MDIEDLGGEGWNLPGEGEGTDKGIFQILARILGLGPRRLLEWLLGD